jgi:hypothetical protein
MLVAKSPKGGEVRMGSSTQAVERSRDPASERGGADGSSSVESI